MKSCSLYGAGFVNVPGTDACIKIGGYVTVEGTTKQGLVQRAWARSLSLEASAPHRMTATTTAATRARLPKRFHPVMVDI
jgi:hypothetical protein